MPETNDASCCGTDCCNDAATSIATDILSTAIGDVKTAVREKYARAASANESCCESTCCDDLSMVGDSYDDIVGYLADADLGLGCGLPTEHANLQPGQTVLDLGSGAGIDAFIARQVVGESGRVIGVDMTPEMIVKARANAEKLGYGNVEFLPGDIEALPLEEATVDVIISNCVLNLVPSKAAAFAEMHRVLRPGGHFCVSDIVHRGTMPEAVRRSAELYAGCVAGAMEHDAYLDLLGHAGFKDVHVVKARAIDIPDEALTSEERKAYQASDAALLSVTVVGTKS